MAASSEERFRALYDQHHPAILAYFVRRIGSQDALDATDDVFAVAWRRLSLVPAGDEALCWLYAVARNVVANRLRSERRRSRLLARLGGLRPPEILAPEPEVLRNLEGKQVLELLASLRPADQELVLLSYWEGLSHSEIGEVLGCTKGAVDARMHRALERMRRAIRQNNHGTFRQAGRAPAEEEQAW